MQPAPLPSPRAALPFASFASASFPREELLDLMDRLPANMALLDDVGGILAVNAAWRTFAEDNDAGSTETGVGANYLAACDAAARTGDVEAARFAAGLRSVLRGERASFELETACVLAGEAQLVRGRVTLLSDPLARYVMVSHEVVSAVYA